MALQAACDRFGAVAVVINDQDARRGLQQVRPVRGAAAGAMPAARQNATLRDINRPLATQRLTLSP